MSRWFLILICFFSLPTFAQVTPGTAYIPVDGSVYLHANGQLGVYGNMRNDGTLSLPTGSSINFYGKLWENAQDAGIRDESSDGKSATGGWVYFMQPNPLTLSDSSQQVRGGYNVSTLTGCTFPNVGVFNGYGIHLDDLNDMRVNHTIDLGGGSVYLDGWNLLVGNNDTGSIRNYNSDHFVVTNNGSGGFLYRDKITFEDRLVVFPVGTGNGEYTPAIVYNLQVPSRFRVHVGDSVYSQLTGGESLWRTSTNKTWDIGKTTPGGSVYVALVHRLPDEGPLFDSNRDSAYIARYTTAGYDVGLKKTPVSPNPYTSGPPDQLGAVNDRRVDNFGTIESFAKLVTDTGHAPQPTRLLFFKAYRVDDDSVYLDWGTSKEFNCEGFEIERKLPDDTGFIKIGFADSKSANGYSYVPLDYHALDQKNFSGIILYRLKVLAYDGTYFYSDIQVVRGSDVKGEFIVWPNPSTVGYVNIYIGNLQSIKQIELMDEVGRQWIEQVFTPPLPANSYFRLDVHKVPGGWYFLNLYDAKEHRSYTKKIMLIRQNY